MGITSNFFTSIVVLTNLLTKEIIKTFPFTMLEMKYIPHT